MRRIVFVMLLWILLSIAISFAQDKPSKHVIACSPSDSTTFFYTNKITAFYYGEACRLNATPFQGLNVSTHEYFEDYLLQFDGNVLDRSSADVFIYSDRIVRKYSPQQITEEVSLLDSLNILKIKITSQVHGAIEMIPAFPGSRRPQDFAIRWEREFGMLHVGQKELMENASAGKLPAWAVVATRPTASFAAYDANQRERFAKLFASPAFLPGALHTALRDSVLFYVMVGGDTNKLMTGLHSGK